MSTQDEIEAAVLGALLNDPSLVVKAAGTLTQESFKDPTHAAIFTAMTTLSNRGRKVDLLTVRKELQTDAYSKLLDPSVDAALHLNELLFKVGSTAHFDDHLLLLLEEQARSIALQWVADEAQRIRTDDVFDLVGEISALAQRMNAALDKGGTSTTLVQDRVVERLLEIEQIKSADGVTGIPTGLRELDRITNGWQRTDLIILAARPGMGKTSLALKLADSAQRAGYPVALASLEMADWQLIDKLNSMNAEVDLQKLRTNRLSQDDWRKVMDSSAQLRDIYINDTGGLNILQLQTWARRMVYEHGVKLLIIDYITIMGETGNKRHQNRENVVSDISRGLKATAKELDIPIIALAQLNRAVEKRGGESRPKLSDLRESGAIEQDADMVTFIYRPEYYGIRQTETGDSTAQLAELIVEKHRNGATGSIDVRFIAEYTKFCDLENATSFLSKLTNDKPSWRDNPFTKDL